MADRLSPVTSRVKLPAAAALCAVTSILSGYPVGSRCLLQLRQAGAISPKDATRVSVVCSTSGPMFLVGSVGAGMLGSAAAGGILLASHLIGVFLTAALFLPFLKKPQSASFPALNAKAGGFAENIQSGTISVLCVGGFIAFFCVVAQALDAGFTIVQVRSKVAGARELIECTRSVADVLAAAGKADEVPLLIDDRLDAVLAARDMGIKVDGVHVGQSDIPVEVCRRYLGEDSIVGLSAAAHEMRAYIETADLSTVDYLGVGPLHETATKPDCGKDDDGRIITRSLEELAELRRVSPKPIVVGGGVKAADIPGLARTGVDGFFVVSAVAGAPDPYAAAAELVNTWRANRA